jgi:hypothetical protein
LAEQEGELQELVHALETEVRRLLAEIEELTKEDPAGCLAEALRLITAFSRRSQTSFNAVVRIHHRSLAAMMSS